MLLFYIDEYGDDSMRTDPADGRALKPGVSDWFVLSAVGIRDSSRKPLAEAIFAIKQRHFGPGMDVQPWGASEVKGRYLFRAARSVATGHVLESPAGYRVLDTQGKVDALIEDFGLVIARFRPLIFACRGRQEAAPRAQPRGATARCGLRLPATARRVDHGEAACGRSGHSHRRPADTARVVLQER